MISDVLFLFGTLFLSLNFIRPFGLAIADWFYFGALLMMILETMTIDKENAKAWIKNEFYLPAGLILFGSDLSTFHSDFVQIAIMETVQQLYVITLFICMTWIMVKRGKTSWVIKAFIISGVFTAAIALVDYFAGTRLGPLLSGASDLRLWYRYAGTLRHPNKLGYYLVLTSLLSLIQLPGKKTIRKRIFWMFIISIQLFGIYLSGSLTAYIGIVFASFVLLITSLSLQRRLFDFAIILLLILLSVSLWIELNGSQVMQPGSIRDQSLVSRSLSRVQNITTITRLEVYRQSWQDILKSPLIGAGFDQASTSGISMTQREFETSVHNTLLQIWYVGGIFAFLGYLIIYVKLAVSTISTLWNYQKRHLEPLFAGLAAATLVILLMDQFQDAIYQREKWLVIGLFVSISLIRHDPQSTSTNV